MNAIDQNQLPINSFFSKKSNQNDILQFDESELCNSNLHTPKNIQEEDNPSLRNLNFEEKSIVSDSNMFSEVFSVQKKTKKLKIETNQESNESLSEQAMRYKEGLDTSLQKLNKFDL